MRAKVGRPKTSRKRPPQLPLSPENTFVGYCAPSESSKKRVASLTMLQGSSVLIINGK